MLKRADLNEEYLRACHLRQFDRANSIQLKMNLLETGNSWQLADNLKYDDSVISVDGYISTKEFGGAEVLIANHIKNNQEYFAPVEINKSYNLGEEQEFAIRGLTGCKFGVHTRTPGERED